VEHHLLAGRGQAVRHFLEVGGEERLALGADNLAQIDAIDRRLVGDAEVEVAALLRRPVEQQRAKRQLAGGERRHRQPFL
jgi:hypothetical protein